MPQLSRVSLSIADTQDRWSIYASRHQVYARELAQHRENAEGSHRPTAVCLKNPSSFERVFAPKHWTSGVGQRRGLVALETASRIGNASIRCGPSTEDSADY